MIFFVFELEFVYIGVCEVLLDGWGLSLFSKLSDLEDGLVGL